MATMRTAIRFTGASCAGRAVKVRRFPQYHRFNSSSSPSSNGRQQSHSMTAIYGGLAGGAFAAALGYGWYYFSGAKTAVNAAHQAKSYFDSSKQKIQQASPSPNEALDWLRKQTHFYASFVPGGKHFVDSAFQDLDSVREKHGEEVDKIVRQAYDELRDVSNKDLSVSTATEAWQVLQKHVKRITDLAGDSAHDILSNHPQIQAKLGAHVDQLRSLGDSFGPEANNIVSDTWSQVRDLLAGGGISAAIIPKLRKLIEEKTEEVKKLGDTAWSKGVEELKPYLDKNPKINELLNQNKRDLISGGNISELWSKAKDASSSGSIDDLEKFIIQSADKAKQKSNNLFGDDISSTLKSYIDQVLPGGADQLMPQFQQFQEMIQNADTKGLEKVVKDTVSEIKDLLERKLEEGKKHLGDNSTRRAKE